jgi:hypothetical protein
MREKASTVSALAVLFGFSALPFSVFGQSPKEPMVPIDALEFFRPELSISSSNVPLEQAMDQLPNRAAWQSLALSGSAPRVLIDPRSGTAVNVLASQPILPGDGTGNAVSLTDVSRLRARP